MRASFYWWLAGVCLALAEWLTDAAEWLKLTANRLWGQADD